MFEGIGGTVSFDLENEEQVARGGMVWGVRIASSSGLSERKSCRRTGERQKERKGAVLPQTDRTGRFPDHVESLLLSKGKDTINALPVQTDVNVGDVMLMGLCLLEWGS